MDLYGYWPSFHDAQVPSYQAPSANSPIVTFTLQTWEMTDQIDAQGYFVLCKHALVSFRFESVQQVEMDAFQAGNILFGLTFTPNQNDPTFRVELESVMDMSGAFTARSGAVVAIIPCGADGIPT